MGSDPHGDAHSSPLRRSTKNETPLLSLSFPACVHYICSGRGRKYFRQRKRQPQVPPRPIILVQRRPDLLQTAQKRGGRLLPLQGRHLLQRSNSLLSTRSDLRREGRAMPGRFLQPPTCPDGAQGAKKLESNQQIGDKTPEAPVKLRKTCTDPLYSCDDSQTCCPLDEGGFGCCPLGGDAVCCPDKENCCPHGYVCDPSGGTCSP